MGFGRGVLLWLLGVPIPIIILLALFWHHWACVGVTRAKTWTTKRVPAPGADTRLFFLRSASLSRTGSKTPGPKRKPGR